VASLRLQLADRDRRLADLTEHSLQILDKLAAAREELAGQERMREHVQQLEVLLADARRRCRAAGRVVLAPEPQTEQAFQVVVWGATEAHRPQIGELLAALPHAPVTLLLGVGVPPDGFALQHASALGVLEGDDRPATAWNRAFASTQAPVLVMLRAGALPAPGAVEQLAAAAAAEDVLLATPLLRRGDTRTLGCRDRGAIDLEPAAAPAGPDVQPVTFGDPVGFALGRAAFQRHGLFDEDLRTDLALAEWTLRGAAQGLRCLGVPGAEVGTPPGPADDRPDDDPAGDAAARECDRLVVVARHQPRELADAAASLPGFWLQPADAVAAALQAAFRRLPHAAEFPAAVDLLAAQAGALAASVRTLPELRECLRAVAAALDVAGAGELPPPALAARLADAAAEIRARAAAVPELRADIARHAVAVREQKDEMLARAGTIDALKDEMIERERAIQSLREELVHRQTQIDSLQRDIEEQSELHAEVERLERAARENEERAHQIAQLQAEIAQNVVAIARRQIETAQMQATIEALRKDLAATNAARDGLRQDLAATAAERDGLREVAAERERLREDLAATAAERERLREELGAARQQNEGAQVQAAARQRELEQSLAVESERLKKLLDELETARTGHESLRHEHGTLQEQRIELESRAHDIVLTLRGRERWIVALLEELERRRLKLRRRKLSQDERDFLAQQAARRAQP
jgi:hypothetical protein